jgi:hypothetical protein
MCTGVEPEVAAEVLGGSGAAEGGLGGLFGGMDGILGGGGDAFAGDLLGGEGAGGALSGGLGDVLGGGIGDAVGGGLGDIIGGGGSGVGDVLGGGADAVTSDLYPGTDLGNTVTDSLRNLNSMGDYTPLEETTGASMDTSGLNKIGSDNGWLSNMGQGFTQGLGQGWSAQVIGRALGNIGPGGLAAGALGARAQAQRGQAQMDRFNQVNGQINNMYAPGSPEYNSLWQEMSRKDAAAGRNSQYGPRSVDLAGKIAGIKGNMLSSTLASQNTMFNSGLNNSTGTLGGMFGVYGQANPPQAGLPQPYQASWDPTNPNYRG